MTTNPVKTSSANDKKDVQKLQRAIVDGLEDVKAQDIQVFDTEHITSLFERVIVASGTSNRQTKALAASVRDAVREAGFGKPRIEGEDNGEWIIVDCGAAVAHIMQPAIRNYYHLEEIWGDKPIRLKFGAPRPATAAPAPAPAKKAPAKTSLRRSTAARTAVREAERAEKAKAPAKKAAAKGAPAKGAAGKSVARKAPVKSAGKTAAKAPVKTAAKKSASKTSSRKA